MTTSSFSSIVFYVITTNGRVFCLPSILHYCIAIAIVRANERKRQIKMHGHHQRHHNYAEIVAATSIHFGHKNIKLKKKKNFSCGHIIHNYVCAYIVCRNERHHVYFLFGCCASHACVGFLLGFVRRCRDH